MNNENEAQLAVQPEPAPALSSQDERAFALGAEWMRREASQQARYYASCYPPSSDGRSTFEMFANWIETHPGPAHEQLLADALALEKVKAVVEALEHEVKRNRRHLAASTLTALALIKPQSVEFVTQKEPRT